MKARTSKTKQEISKFEDEDLLFTENNDEDAEKRGLRANSPFYKAWINQNFESRFNYI